MTALWRDQRGAVAMLTALALPVLLGSAALACEAGWWVVETRSLQNAADAAAISAAFAGGSEFTQHAEALAAVHGFVAGARGVAVDVARVACIDPGGCIRVTIAKPSVAGLSRVSPRLSATALASLDRRVLVG